MERQRLALVCPAVLKRAVRVALVVGTALNAINHYELALGDRPTAGVIAQISLTYLVPFLVSVHGQMTGRQSFG